MSVKLTRTGQFYSRTAGNPPSTSFTVMAWVKVQPLTAAFQKWFTFGASPGTSADEVSFGTDGDGVTARLRTPAAGTNGPVLTIGQWYHMALVVEGTGVGQVKAYIDGALAITRDGQAAISSAKIHLGHNDSAAEDLGGSIRAVKLWDVALNATEIAAEKPYVQPQRLTNLNAWYRFTDIGNIGDLSGNGRDWTVTGSPTSDGDNPTSLSESAPTGPKDIKLSDPTVLRTGGGAALAASLVGSAIVAAALTTGIPLGASATGTATVAANLTTGIPLAAAMTGTAAVTGALTTAIQLAATLTGTASVAGALTTGIPLAAAMTGAATVAAALTTGIQLAAGLTGTAAVSASLTTAIVLAASLTGTATVSAALTTQITLQAAVTGTATVNAALTTAILLASAVTGTATVSADLTAGSGIAATLVGAATVAASLTTGIPLAVALVGTATTAANLTTGILLASSVTGTATVAAALTTAAGGFVATLTATATTTGVLTTGIALAAALTVTATISAGLNIPVIPVDGAASGGWVARNAIIQGKAHLSATSGLVAKSRVVRMAVAKLEALSDLTGMARVIPNDDDEAIALMALFFSSES